MLRRSAKAEVVRPTTPRSRDHDDGFGATGPVDIEAID
jgi:hypothetical protein